MNLLLKSSLAEKVEPRIHLQAIESKGGSSAKGDMSSPAGGSPGSPEKHSV